MGNLALCTSPSQANQVASPAKTAKPAETKESFKALPQQAAAAPGAKTTTTSTADKVGVKSVVVTPYGEGVVSELRGEVVVVDLTFGAKAYMRVEEVKVKPGSAQNNNNASKPSATAFAVAAVPNLRVFPGAAVVTPFGKGYVQSTRGNGTSFVVVLEFGATAYLRSEIVDVVPLDRKLGDRVTTKYGGGSLEAVREDGFCVVTFDFGGKGYLRSNEVSPPTPYSLAKEEEMKNPTKAKPVAAASPAKPVASSPAATSPAKSAPATGSPGKASSGKKSGSPSKGASPAAKKAEGPAAAPPPPMEPLPAAAASAPSVNSAPAPAPAPPKEEPAPADPDEEKDDADEGEDGATATGASGGNAPSSSSSSQAKKKKKKKGKN